MKNKKTLSILLLSESKQTFHINEMLQVNFHFLLSTLLALSNESKNQQRQENKGSNKSGTFVQYFLQLEWQALIT